MTTPKLKPCPFCGKEQKLEHDDLGFPYPSRNIIWWVDCPTKDCPLRGTDWARRTKRGAINAWNRRKGESK